MDTNYAPLLADIFLIPYKAEFIQSLLLALRLNFTYGYIVDVLSTNNPEFEKYLWQMYPVELEIKDTTESNISASYLDLQCTFVDRKGGGSTSCFHFRQTRRFQLPYQKLSVPE